MKQAVPILSVSVQRDMLNQIAVNVIEGSVKSMEFANVRLWFIKCTNVRMHAFI